MLGGVIFGASLSMTRAVTCGQGRKRRYKAITRASPLQSTDGYVRKADEDRVMGVRYPLNYDLFFQLSNRWFFARKFSIRLIG